MESRKIRDRLTGRMTRRELGKALAAAGIGMAAVPLAAQRAQAASNLEVFTWAGYDVPELFPAYMEKYGEPPRFSLFGSEEEGLQKMLAGFTPDVAHPCSYNIKRWRDAGILKPVDVARLPHWPDVWDSFKTIPDTSFDGQAYFVPWDTGNVSIVYRADLVDPADVTPESWSLLFNEKYQGRLAMYDTDTTLIEIAAKVLGYEGQAWATLSDAELEQKIKPMLQKQRDLTRFYWSDPTVVQQALASGEVVAAYAWNETYRTLKDEGFDVRYMVPKEGILTWVCGLVLLAKGPGDEQAAYDYMDAMLAPEVGAYQMTESNYGHSNRKAYDLVDKDLLESLGYGDPEKAFADPDVPPDPEEPYRGKYITLVEQVKAGL